MNTRSVSVSVVDRARRYVEKIPGAISGQAGHNQTMVVARVLVSGFGLSEQDALRLLREYNGKCTPPWSERELIHKVQSALITPSTLPHGYLLRDGEARSLARAPRPRPAPRPAQPIDPATAVENYLQGFRCAGADLWYESPVRPPDDWRTDAAVLVANLYRPGELINYVTDYVEQGGKARPVGIGRTIERDEFLRLFSQATPQSKAGGWLRMNPVDGRGIGDAHVTAHRFALLECDNVPLDLQLSLLTHLSLPVAAILTSGGRSVHAWVQINAPDAATYRALVDRMLNLLARFGVDLKNRNPSRLSRLPGAQRIIGADGDGAQRLLYLSANPEQKRIFP